MYVSGSDDTGKVGVGVFSGTSPEDADYQAAIDDIMAANGAAAARQRPSVFVLIVDREVPPPPAVWRKRFSDANKRLAHAPHYMLLVTDNRTARGVFTAVNWLTGAPPGHTYKALPSASAADAWLTETLGEAFAVVASIEVEVRLNGWKAAQG